ncbi:hypothetical protein L3X38_028264 [Prunus dulcis]|uniref:Stress-response A/B barrel domain-containing protein n=1 Tax=Prunus dulcis TaxID=3755 RepID=A0AAD4Z098_PRUDU|nr:hypothetical protein L3X38_028264 [Prunus dulcis]
MLIQSQCSVLSPIRLTNPHRSLPIISRHAPFNACRMNGAIVISTWLGRKKNRGVTVSATEEQSSSLNVQKKRKVVDHICLLKAKEDLSDEEEKHMLDFLYTTQYQMRGILSVSLGRILNENIDKYTHAVYMRFQRKEDIGKFYENPFYLRVLNEHVLPYCHGLTNVDYESEVEDDIIPIFRKGEEFNFGVEFVLLLSLVDNASGRVEEALVSLEGLIMGFPSIIVQSTQGLNFNPSSKEFTHGVVIRFRSLDAFEIFVGSSEYKEIWKSKFDQITRKTLSLHFSVDPVGSEIM